MDDLKQISHEIAQAIFDSIEQDRTLILSRIADVVHKELAVRLPELEREMHPMYEVRPLEHGYDPSKSFERMNEIIKSVHDKMGITPEQLLGYEREAQKETATQVREREIARLRGQEEAARAEAWRKTKELLSSGAVMFPSAPAPRVENAYEPRWYAWDFAAKKREIS